MRMFTVRKVSQVSLEWKRRATRTTITAAAAAAVVIAQELILARCVLLMWAMEE
jgi:hypothetical protein